MNRFVFAWTLRSSTMFLGEATPQPRRLKIFSQSLPGLNVLHCRLKERFLARWKWSWQFTLNHVQFSLWEILLESPALSFLFGPGGVSAKTKPRTWRPERRMNHSWWYLDFWRGVYSGRGTDRSRQQFALLNAEVPEAEHEVAPGQGEFATQRSPIYGSREFREWSSSRSRKR